jgi:zinc transport system substrate-binding protein
MLRRLPFIALFGLALLSFAVTGRAAPRVVVSIAPLHSLAAGVMQGVAKPTLLVETNSSPHQYMLKPSQMLSLQHADLVVWVGESVESFLPRVIGSLPDKVQVMELSRIPTMTVLLARSGGVWEAEGLGEHEHSHGDIDGHLWLDPHNASLIVRELVERLSLMDPAHETQYRANGARLQQRLDKLDASLRKTLAPLHKKPFLVFHDAYQYLERRYGLDAVGAILVDPGRKPGARRLAEIRERVKAQHVKCVFSEPQFPAKLMQVVMEGMDIKHATLDPMGIDLKPGPELYFELMNGLGKNLTGCLQ